MACGITIASGAPRCVAVVSCYVGESANSVVQCDVHLANEQFYPFEDGSGGAKSDSFTPAAVLCVPCFRERWQRVRSLVAAVHVHVY